MSPWGPRFVCLLHFHGRGSCSSCDFFCPLEISFFPTGFRILSISFQFHSSQSRACFLLTSRALYKYFFFTSEFTS